MMKLGIGTAQFGLDYGISNRIGRTTAGEIERILDLAAQHGVIFLDTAPAYGGSEESIGAALCSGHSFRIITKTPRLAPDEREPAEVVRSSFLHSLERLRQSSLYGLLFHAPADLLGDSAETLFDAAQLLKQEGLVQKIGVSVYTGEEIDRISARFKLDLIQAPVNVFDQRLIRSGRLRRLKDSGIEIHARSAFLQGLLLMSPDELPSYFDRVKSHVRHYREWLRQYALTPTRAALQFATALPEVHCVVCGVNDSAQFRELIADCTAPVDASRIAELAEFAIEDERILNPSLWHLAEATV